MEVRIESNNRTQIARGITPIYKNRKFVGHFWTNTNQGHTSHISQLCHTWRSDIEYHRLPVYEEDGQWYWYDILNDHYSRTELCNHCRDYILDEDWKEKGLCFGSEDTGFIDGDKRVIEEYCVHCPVTNECFEYGATLEREHGGTIWGGVYFPDNPTKRRKVIAERLGRERRPCCKPR